MHGGEPDRAEPQVVTDAFEGLPHRLRLVAGDEQLEAELSHIGHAQGTNPRVADLDLLRREVGEPLLRQVIGADPLKELAGAGPLDRQQAVRRCHVSDRGELAFAQFVAQHPLDPAMGDVGDDHQELIIGQSRDREVCLDTAALIAPLRVHNPANRTGHRVDTEPIDDGRRIGALNEELGHQGHVHCANGLANDAVFLGHPGCPEAAAPRPGDLADRLARRVEPLDEFPSGRVGKVRSLRLPHMMKRGSTDVARRVLVERRVAAVTEEDAELLDDALGSEPQGVLMGDGALDCVAGIVHGAHAVDEP